MMTFDEPRHNAVIDPSTSLRVDPERSRGIDRRTFLRWVPRQVFAGVKSLMSDEASSEIVGFPREASANSRTMAVIDIQKCLAWGMSPCQACYLRCPLRDEAMVLDDGRPLIVASACDGCGVCVEACRTVNDIGAIRLKNATYVKHVMIWR